MPLPSYISDRLNTENLSIIYDTVGSPVGFDTTIITLDNGYQYAFDRYDQPRARFNIGDRIYKKAEWEYLKNFFYNVRGSAIAFRYKNWGDYQGINQAIAIGNGIKTVFQLVKNYDGYQKIIEKPINVTVFIDGILVTSGLTIFPESGIIAFAIAPITAAVITASFEFDLKVRFESDSLSGRLEAARTFDKEEFISVPTVAIVELRSPFAVYFLNEEDIPTLGQCLVLYNIAVNYTSYYSYLGVQQPTGTFTMNFIDILGKINEIDRILVDTTPSRFGFDTIRVIADSGNYSQGAQFPDLGGAIDFYFLQIDSVTITTASGLPDIC